MTEFRFNFFRGLCGRQGPGGLLLFFLCCSLALFLSGASCPASLGGKKGSRKTYGRNAKQLYKKAMKELKGGNYQQARKLLQFLKTTYPFSSYATFADVRIADSYFKAGKYLRAIDIYKMFAKVRPSHSMAPYAAYQAAFSYYKLIPSDWFLVPPAYEKDPTHTRQAIKALRSFLQSYPNHKLKKKATKYLKKCLLQLARHEMYVARFYASRGQHRAVAWRLAYLLKKYPGVGLDAEARFRLGKAYLQMKKKEKARQVFQELLQRHPKSSYHSKARSQLSSLSKTTSRPAPRRRAVPPPLLRKTPRPVPRRRPRTTPL